MSVKYDVTIVYRASSSAVFHQTYFGISHVRLRELMQDKSIIRVDKLRKEVKWV